MRGGARVKNYDAENMFVLNIKRKMKRKGFFIAILMALCTMVHGQNVPENIVYTQIYDFVDELVMCGVVDMNTAIRPYSRGEIAKALQQARQSNTLTTRQKQDLDFYCRAYDLELEEDFENRRLTRTDGKTWMVSAWQPVGTYRNDDVKVRVTPLLGAMTRTNKNGTVVDRWWGADLQMQVGEHISFYANARDNAYWGEWLKKPLEKMDARLAEGRYFNLLPGVEYKEADYGGDYMEMRGGVILHGKYGHVGIVKENVAWGESRRSSNILSGRAPSFPMVTLKFQPVKWIELNYIHGWLVSNAYDSSAYYMEYMQNDSVLEKMYRPANKYIAANMLTITPIKKLRVSIGNSIIYGESSPHLSYFMPLAYYKGLDHAQSKGLNAENQNAQVFMMLSSRNIPYVELYGQLLIDEFKFARLKSSNKESNPISIQVGGKFVIPRWNMYGNVEYTRTNIITYKHSVVSLPYTSNGYYLGHYLGDNSQEVYGMLGWKPLSRLDVELSFSEARHYNDYAYVRKTVGNVISQDAFKDMTWSNTTIGLRATYELTNNVYAKMGVEWNNARGYDGTNRNGTSEMCATAKTYLNEWTPAFYQGKNLTLEAGLSVGF